MGELIESPLLRNGLKITYNTFAILLRVFERYFSLNNDAIRIKIPFNYPKNNSQNYYNLFLTHSLGSLMDSNFVLNFSELWTKISLWLRRKSISHFADNSG